MEAGIEDILIITGRGKRTLEDHFDRSFELEARLEASGKCDELEEVRRISDMAAIHYIRQKEPRGLGAAVAMAEPHVGGEPFAVLRGDDIIPDSRLLKDMIEVHDRYGRSVIAVQEVARSEIHLYGAIEPEFVEERLARVTRIVEKPATEDAPSNYAAIGRYVLTPEVFEALRDTPADQGGEVQLTDALNLLPAARPCPYLLEGVRYDIGKKLDYLRPRWSWPSTGRTWGRDSGSSSRTCAAEKIL